MLARLHIGVGADTAAKQTLTFVLRMIAAPPLRPGPLVLPVSLPKHVTRAAARRVASALPMGIMRNHVVTHLRVVRGKNAKWMDKLTIARCLRTFDLGETWLPEPGPDDDALPGLRASSYTWNVPYTPSPYEVWKAVRQAVASWLSKHKVCV